MIINCSIGSPLPIIFTSIVLSLQLFIALFV